MSRSFASASSQYVNYASGIGGSAFTFSGWFHRASSGAAHTICSRSKNSGSSGDVSLVLANAANKLQLYAETSGGSAANITGGTTINASTWYHFAAVFAASDYRLYLNGALENASAHAGTPATGVEIAISSRIYTATRAEYFNGLIAEVGLHGVALTAAEIASLARGRSPLEIRRVALEAFYFPSHGRNWSDRDYSGYGRELTPSGSPTWGDDPPQTIQRRRRRVGVAAAPTGNRRRRLLCRAG